MSSRRLLCAALIWPLLLTACEWDAAAAGRPGLATVPPITTTTTITAATASPTAVPTATIPIATATIVAPAPTATDRPEPTPDAAAAGRRVRLPILMYHYVEPWPADAGEIRRGLTVKPEDFAEQMLALHRRGYVTVSLYDLVYALMIGQPLPPKAVVITFDDGYRSLLDYAVPTMRAYGYTGTIFVITQFMDDAAEPYLSWADAEELYRQGWKIEPHTKTHNQLAGRDRDFQLYQLLGSFQTVAAHIGAPPRFICYPAGKYDETTLQIAREVGFWGGVTVDFGRVHSAAEIYKLRRIRIDGRATLADFLNALGENQ